ncbi:protein of unknown function [Methylorubrum extorquens DM4]|uniref:Uncharacterized protein n=1 Tax=Methylorubrum extorquens (strain DSM 6343 / CIP 106787 / DM4) TaxID=661410 RepID=C7CHJ2_METED|nr:protein of unknown function [Methylorubrum extorquens DM4]
MRVGLRGLTESALKLRHQALRTTSNQVGRASVGAPSSVASTVSSDRVCNPDRLARTARAASRGLHET